jgi:hypothetical protein
MLFVPMLGVVVSRILRETKTCMHGLRCFIFGSIKHIASLEKVKDSKLSSGQSSWSLNIILSVVCFVKLLVEWFHNSILLGRVGSLAVDLTFFPAWETKNSVSHDASFPKKYSRREKRGRAVWSQTKNHINKRSPYSISIFKARRLISWQMEMND